MSTDTVKITPLSNKDSLLVVKGLKLNFFTYAGVVKALDGVSFMIKQDETLGIVGETGCGKSITAHSILRLVRHPGRILEGTIHFRSKYTGGKWKNLLDMSDKQMREIRGHHISMIFQDPMTYLNPVFKISNQLKESILLHQDLKEEAVLVQIEEVESKLEQLELQEELSPEQKNEQEQLLAKLRDLEEQLKNPPVPTKKQRHAAAYWKSIQVLRLVRMPDPANALDSYPFELSGGMRQRVMIALALASTPDLLIADEATTALDVTIQAQILNLMGDLREKLKTTLVLITHDLGIVAEQCERVIVMYAGNIIEDASTIDLFKHPAHPYTEGLLAAIPKLEQEHLAIIPGTVPNLIYPPDGCRFHPRCPLREDICEKEKPMLSRVGENHYVACHVRGTSDYVEVEVPADQIEEDKQ